MHGGRSTGPRTPEGLERIRAARTIHGNDDAEARAKNRYRITLLRRVRVGIAAARYQDHLHPDFRARLYDIAPELWPPSPPTGGITAAQDQMRRRAVAAALAPWKRAIADAKRTHLAARKQAAAARAADPNARPRPPRPRPAHPRLAHPRPPHPGSLRSAAHHPTTEALFAALLAELHAPERTMPAPDAGVPEPHAPIPGPSGPAASTHAPHPLEAPSAPTPPNATQHNRPTPPARRAKTRASPPRQNPMHQSAHPLTTMRTGQNPMHQFRTRPTPPSRPACPTAPPADGGRASSATCTGDRPRPPARDRAPSHGTVECNCPRMQLPPNAIARPIHPSG
jgi:hypothetical protein